MTPRDFADESVRAQQPQVASRGGTATAPFFIGMRLAGKQDGLDIGVAQTVDRKLAAVKLISASTAASCTANGFSAR